MRSNTWRWRISFCLALAKVAAPRTPVAGAGQDRDSHGARAAIVSRSRSVAQLGRIACRMRRLSVTMARVRRNESTSHWLSGSGIVWRPVPDAVHVRFAFVGSYRPQIPSRILTIRFAAVLAVRRPISASGRLSNPSTMFR